MNFLDSYFRVYLSIDSVPARREFLDAVVRYYYLLEAEPGFKYPIAAAAFEGVRTSLNKAVRGSGRNIFDSAISTESPIYQNQLSMQGLEKHQKQLSKQDLNRLSKTGQSSCQREEKEEEERKETPSKEGVKKRKPAFLPPTPEEVEAYCQGSGYKVDAAHFCDYYAAQGWRLSNGCPMKDWRAAVRRMHRLDEQRRANAAAGGLFDAYGGGE